MGWTYFRESEESRLRSGPGSGSSPIANWHGTGAVFCCRGCRRVSLSARRFGTMCALCRRSTSASRSTLLAPDSRARTSALRAAARAWRESTVGFGGRSLGSLASYDPLTSSWRTSQLSLDGEASPWPGPLPRWGMTRGGVCSALTTWERRISGSGGGVWPTPTKGDGAKGSAGQVYAGGRPTLSNLAARFPTPRHCAGLRSSGMNRTELYRAMELYPTPTRRDAKTGDAKNKARGTAAGYSPNLNDTAVDLEGLATGQLNPTWVEWLMGFPLGWTVLAPWAIPSSRKRRGKRSRGSSSARVPRQLRAARANREQRPQITADKHG